ncbi:hypothetical protein NSTCB13_04539 [Nostoc sp. DSM 114160]
MPQLQAKSLEMRTPQATKTAVLVIGGAEDKVHGREILRTFFGRAGASKAYITIIPSASREPAIIGGRYIRIFEEMGAQKVEILDIREREQCEASQIKASLEACSGVFLTGGDPTTSLWCIGRYASDGNYSSAGEGGATDVSRHQCRSGGDGASHDCWRREWRDAQSFPSGYGNGFGIYSRSNR